MSNIVIGIYKITSPSGKIYIGQSTNINERWRKYIKFGAKSQIALENSFKKHGAESHLFEVIQSCQGTDLNALERYWQEYYLCVEHGLNCKYTSINGRLGKLSKESIEKIKKAHKGKVISELHKQKLAIAFTGEKNHFYGKKHTDETKSKISAASKGRKLSLEARQKMSESRMGRKGKPWTDEQKRLLSEKKKGTIVSEATKLKISIASKGANNGMYGSKRYGELNPMWGRNHSEETRNKISQIHKGRKMTEESKLKMSIARQISGVHNQSIVLNTETGIYYDSVKYAAKSSNVNYNTLRSKLNGGLINNTTFIKA